MLKGVRGWGPEFMAGQLLGGDQQPPALGSAQQESQAQDSRARAPASDPPPALGPSPGRPSSCTPHLPILGCGGSRARKM